MGIIQNGILGGLSGKVSGVVGSNWKGIKTLRAYSKPANPQTAGQTTQRNKFAYTVAFAKTILTSVINEYWKGKNAYMSPFNSFLKVNIPKANATTGINTTNLITSGSLESSVIDNCIYSGSQITLNWETETIGNGLPTDFILVVIYDKENNVSFVSDAEKQRSEEEVTISVGTGRTASELVAFLSLYRGSEKTLITSTSTSSEVSL